MKASNLYRSFLLGVLTISMLGIQACSKSKDGAPVRSGYYGTAGRGGGAGGIGTNYTYQLAQVSNANPQAVLGFLSAGMDTSQIGSIVSVQAAGHIGLNCAQNQQVIVNGSNGIFIRVIDSMAQQGQYAPIDTFMPVTSGSVMNGQMNLMFQDNFGVVQVTGSYTPSNNNGSVNGTITYRNNSNGQYGTIGSFSLPIAYFLTCQ